MNYYIGTAGTGTVHRVAAAMVNGEWKGSTGAQCNNQIGARTQYLARRHEATPDQIEEMRAAGARLCKRCFPVPAAEVAPTPEVIKELDDDSKQFNTIKDRLIGATGSPGLTSYHGGKVHMTLGEWDRLVTTIETPTAEVEDQGYSEWIDLIESQVYVNAEARVHRDFSSQSGVQGFVGVQKTPIHKTPRTDDVRECAGCEDSENAPHASECQHDGNPYMSEWFMLDGIKKRHIMCDKCGDNLPDEYYV